MGHVADLEMRLKKRLPQPPRLLIGNDAQWEMTRLVPGWRWQPIKCALGEAGKRAPGEQADVRRWTGPRVAG